MRPSARRAKRVLDLAFALPGVALLLVLFPLIALAIRLESAGPVLVRRQLVGEQRRHGGSERGGRRLHDLRGRLFRVRRFRVLGSRLRAVGRRRGEHPRLTRVGRLLRRTSLEHLPLLWSVLRGELSLVGPRPLRAELAEPLYRAWPSSRVHLADVPPGLFGPVRLTSSDEATATSCLCERLLADLGYAATLRRAGFWSALALDVSVLARGAARAQAERRASGNDVIRLDHPRHLHQVDQDPRTLVRTAPVAMGAEVTEGPGTLTAWWYPSRRPALAVAPLPASILEEACDDVRLDDDGGLILAQRLRRREGPSDRLVVELPAGLTEVHHVCAHLLPVWAALARRTACPERAALASAAALVRVAATVSDPRGRLLLTVEIADHELRIAVRCVLRDDVPAPGPADESLAIRLSDLARPRGLVGPAARS